MPIITDKNTTSSDYNSHTPRCTYLVSNLHIWHNVHCLVKIIIAMSKIILSNAVENSMSYTMIYKPYITINAVALQNNIYIILYVYICFILLWILHAETVPPIAWQWKQMSYYTKFLVTLCERNVGWVRYEFYSKQTAPGRERPLTNKDDSHTVHTTHMLHIAITQSIHCTDDTHTQAALTTHNHTQTSQFLHTRAW